MPFLKSLMANSGPPKKINIGMQLIYKGSQKCDKMITVVPQSLRNIFYIATSTKQFCSTTEFTVAPRPSADGKQRLYVTAFGTAKDNANEIWKINIQNGGKSVAQNVDVDYVPKDGDKIICTFEKK